MCLPEMMAVAALFVGCLKSVLSDQSVQRSCNEDNIGGKCFNGELDERLLPIDVVYTWVNGSDLQFQRDILAFKVLCAGDNHWTNGTEESCRLGETITPTLFGDTGQLRFSLRSLFKFSPWVRRIFIVTNGQVPIWLNTSHPRIILVSHRDIFVNLSDLPSFNSNAIEIHLHRIKGLSENFIYFNDDFYLCREVWPRDFLTLKDGTKIYLGSSFPIKKLSKRQQLELTNPSGQTLQAVPDIYVRSLNMVRGLYLVSFTVDFQRQISHVPYLLNRNLMENLWDTFRGHLTSMSSRSFRSELDLQFPSLYFWYFLVKAGGEKRDFVHAADKFKIQDTLEVFYSSLNNSEGDLEEAFKHLADGSNKFACLNDNLDYAQRQSTAAVLRHLQELQRKWLPDPSPFETSKSL